MIDWDWRYSSIKSNKHITHHIYEGDKMFCYQCEETMKGESCTNNGMCGKKGEVADL
jgi:hypothetical protein